MYNLNEILRKKDNQAKEMASQNTLKIPQHTGKPNPTYSNSKALFASFEGRGRKDLGGEGKGRKGRDKGGKVFPLFGS